VYVLSRPYVKLPENANYTVLATGDGGGFAGIISVYVFRTSLYLASKGGNGASANMLNEKRFIEQYGRSAPGSARSLLVFYNELVNAMFPQDLLPRPPFLSVDASNLSAPGVTTPVLEPDGGRTILRRWFGDTRLSELSASCFITAFDLVRRRGILFVNDDLVSPARYGFTEVLRRNHPRRREDPFMSNVQAHYGLDFYIRDVSLASSSPPSTLPAVDVTSLNGAESLLAVDGVYAPNPALPALIHVVNSTGDTSFSRTAVISIGTGTALTELSNNANGGALQWDGTGERLFSFLTNVLSFTSKQIELLFSANPEVKPGQYLRVNFYAQPGTEQHRDLSTFLYSDFLPDLQVVGQQLVKTYTDAIRSFVENFIFA